jgi:hypothetical protein
MLHIGQNSFNIPKIFTYLHLPATVVPAMKGLPYFQDKVGLHCKWLVTIGMIRENIEYSDACNTGPLLFLKCPYTAGGCFLQGQTLHIVIKWVDRRTNHSLQGGYYLQGILNTVTNVPSFRMNAKIKSAHI